MNNNICAAQYPTKQDHNRTNELKKRHPYRIPRLSAVTLSKYRRSLELTKSD